MREHVDLPTLTALQDEWRRHPPVHHLVAAYLAYKPPAAAAAAVDEETARGLLALMQPAADAHQLDTSAWDDFVSVPRH